MLTSAESFRKVENSVLLNVVIQAVYLLHWRTCLTIVTMERQQCARFMLFT